MTEGVVHSGIEVQAAWFLLTNGKHLYVLEALFPCTFMKKIILLLRISENYLEMSMSIESWIFGISSTKSAFTMTIKKVFHNALTSLFELIAKFCGFLTQEPIIVFVCVLRRSWTAGINWNEIIYNFLHITTYKH